jgi:hypothetical protein
MKTRLAITIVFVLSVSGSASAGVIDIQMPLSGGIQNGISYPIDSVPRAYQSFYSDTNNTLSSPLTILGMQFRLRSGTTWRPAGYVGDTWPDAPLNFSDYSVELSKVSSTLLDDEGQYPGNVTSFGFGQADPVTTVRSGPLTVPAFSFDGTGTGNHEWGHIIPFNTPYTLNPGDSLALMIRHGGYGVTGSPPVARWHARNEDFGLTGGIVNTVDSDAASSNFLTHAAFVRFVTVPEPGSLCLLAMGTLAAVVRRRRRVGR